MTSVPWWGATLIKTTQGWRILERDGVLRRLGGSFQRLKQHAAGTATVTESARRVMISSGGGTLYELNVTVELPQTDSW